MPFARRVRVLWRAPRIGKNMDEFKRVAANWFRGGGGSCRCCRRRGAKPELRRIQRARLKANDLALSPDPDVEPGEFWDPYDDLPVFYDDRDPFAEEWDPAWDGVDWSSALYAERLLRGHHDADV